MIQQIRKLQNRKGVIYLLIFLVVISTVWLLSNEKEISVEYLLPFINYNNGKENIIKIIHFSWKTKDLPSNFKELMKTWTEYCYKYWKIMFWTDEDNYNLIKSHYPWFLNTYKSLPRNIYRADVSRYFYLYHYGGIYTDLDNQCLRPFDHLIMNYSIVFGAMKGQWHGTKLKEGIVQNSFMYSKPKQIFWLELIREIQHFKDIARPELHTGPVMLSKKIDSFRNSKTNNSTIHKIKIYPPNYFNPFSWLEGSGYDKKCPDPHYISKEKLRSCRQSMIAKGSYVIQYHAYTWE